MCTGRTRWLYLSTSVGTNYENESNYDNKSINIVNVAMHISNLTNCIAAAAGTGVTTDLENDFDEIQRNDAHSVYYKQHSERRYLLPTVVVDSSSQDGLPKHLLKQLCSPSDGDSSRLQSHHHESCVDLKPYLNIQSNDVYECVTRHYLYQLYSSSSSSSYRTHTVRYLHRSTGRRRSMMTSVMGAAVAAAEATD